MANNLLEQVQNDLDKAKRESVKASLKKMLEDRAKAKATLVGIEDAIVDLLLSVGDKEEDIRAFLNPAE